MPTRSTIRQLIEYRAELIARGLDDDLINDLVRDAGEKLVTHRGRQMKALPTSLTQFAGRFKASQGVGESKSPA
jgi:hypothetical protein